MVHLLQDFLIDGLCNVGQLVGVCCHVVDFYKHLQRGNALISYSLHMERLQLESNHFYLVVIKLAVLHVGRGGDAAHAGVRVVVGVLTHTVWETLLNKKSPSAPHADSTDRFNSVTLLPTLLVPAGGRQGPKRSSPLLHTPPGCLFSNCCCSASPPALTHTHTYSG